VWNQWDSRCFLVAWRRLLLLAGITIWHRPQGVFVASGEGFKQDELQTTRGY
jgi:hypothetical protein